MATVKDDPEYDMAMLAFIRMHRRQQFDVLCHMMSYRLDNAVHRHRRTTPTHDDCRGAFIRAVDEVLERK